MKGRFELVSVSRTGTVMQPKTSNTRLSLPRALVWMSVRARVTQGSGKRVRALVPVSDWILALREHLLSVCNLHTILSLLKSIALLSAVKSVRIRAFCSTSGELVC